MQIAMLGVGILSLVCGLVSLVCWVMTLIKMFQDQEKGGVGHGIGGVICGLYALIWGWQNHEKHEHKTIMMVWTGAVIGNVVLQVLVTVLAGALAG